MADGAHLGVGPERALETILGGAPQPSPGECQSAEEMRAEILATTEDPHTYGGTALFCANCILRWLMADSSRASRPVENVYAIDADGHRDYTTVVSVGWSGLMREDGFWPEDIDLTGFMWGWAVNAARRCLELPPVENPAIISFYHQPKARLSDGAVIGAEALVRWQHPE